MRASSVLRRYAGCSPNTGTQRPCRALARGLLDLCTASPSLLYMVWRTVGSIAREGAGDDSDESTEDCGSSSDGGTRERGGG